MFTFDVNEDFVGFKYTKYFLPYRGMHFILLVVSLGEQSSLILNFSFTVK